MNTKEKNAERFTGFADVYDSARPTVPEYPIKRICAYLGKKPDTVVDLGCGTGLSSAAWKNTASHIIGVEPSEDMLTVAKKKECENVKFIKAFSDNIPVDDNSADVVTASQSFHWMEPKSTLREVNRILKYSGVFAVIDCDWPAVTQWQAEKAYMDLYEKVKSIEHSYPEINDTFVRYSKNNHLKNISESGYFRYTREILFSNTEKCTRKRFVDLILSQGSLQTIIKKKPELILKDIDEFSDTINNILPESAFDIDFCYRMRIGIK